MKNLIKNHINTAFYAQSCILPQQTATFTEHKKKWGRGHEMQFSPSDLAHLPKNN
jgi:hypothetical protein